MASDLKHRINILIEDALQELFYKLDAANVTVEHLEEIGEAEIAECYFNWIAEGEE